MSKERIYDGASIEGYRRNLKGAINACENGDIVELDLTSARHIDEILRRVVLFLDSQSSGMNKEAL